MPGIKILTSVGYYLPGYKAGGPIRTLANMVGKMGDEFQFKIITADRDFDDTKPYSGIRINGWNRVGKAEVLYMSPNRHSLSNFRRLLCSTEYDVLYLNSFFSPYFTIKPLLLRRLQLIPDKSLILAPRGEFSPGALGLKSLKKLVYLWTAKAFGLYRGVIWQASSEYEEADIRQWFGKDVPVVVAPDLPPMVHSADELLPKSEKSEGCLKIVFLSRISRKKNLDSALKMLKGLNGKVKFNIYGPMEDKTYWAECEKIIGGLSGNIEVRYCGSVAHDKVGTVMNEHDLFFFPTLGENFGHVILESLLAGCPVLISDKTPWRNLAEQSAGWDFPLTEMRKFHDILNELISMDEATYKQWALGARKYGIAFIDNPALVDANRKLFLRAIKN